MINLQSLNPNDICQHKRFQHHISFKRERNGMLKIQIRNAFELIMVGIIYSEAKHRTPANIKIMNKTRPQ
jgi:hypothetical protein